MSLNPFFFLSHASGGLFFGVLLLLFLAWIITEAITRGRK